MDGKPTMTVAEVHKDLRRCGVNWSETAIRDMIKSGQFPGIAYYTKNWRYHVFTADYEAFKREKKLSYIDNTGSTSNPEERRIVRHTANDKYEQAIKEFEESMKGVVM